MIFALLFSVMFFFLHAADATRAVIREGLEDMGGIPWLYSAVCLIFSILAGFVIQHEWDQWNALVEAMNGEVSALQHLWLWSQQVLNLGGKLREAMKQYLTATIQDEWRARAPGESEAAGQAFAVVQEEASTLFQHPDLRMTTVGIIGDLLRHREHRLHSGQRRMPPILKVTVGFADGLVIVLSLFIGVKHLWLDYLFTLSIALLAYVVYLVIDDLDHPLRPGIWHVTSKRYEHLLAQLQQHA
ncbi:MAG: hypothetical protein HY255_04850 [Betaproteobacteria bacterium]|nr:hypothetical protein [Betaproteobacteria bacterium]